VPEKFCSPEPGKLVLQATSRMQIFADQAKVNSAVIVQVPSLAGIFYSNAFSIGFVKSKQTKTQTRRRSMIVDDFKELFSPFIDEEN
jgi:hypothetical protein